MSFLPQPQRGLRTHCRKCRARKGEHCHMYGKRIEQHLCREVDEMNDDLERLDLNLGHEFDRCSANYTLGCKWWTEGGKLCESCTSYFENYEIG